MPNKKSIIRNDNVPDDIYVISQGDGRAQIKWQAPIKRGYYFRIYTGETEKGKFTQAGESKEGQTSAYIYGEGKKLVKISSFRVKDQECSVMSHTFAIVNFGK